MGLLIAVASMALHNYFKPFTKPDDNLDQAIVLSVISFSLFSGLLLKTDTATDDEYEIGAFAALLTAVNIVAIVMPPVHLLAALYQKRKRKKNSLQIAPEEPTQKETERKHDANTSRDDEDRDDKGEGKAPDSQLSAFDGGAINACSASTVPPEPQPQPLARDNLVFSESEHPPSVMMVPIVQPPLVPFVPTVQPLAPRVVAPTVPLAAPPAELPTVQQLTIPAPPQQQQTAPAVLMPSMFPTMPMSEQPASRYAYDTTSAESRAVLPAPWTCLRCTYEHGLECCAAKASCCMCGETRPERSVN